MRRLMLVSLVVLGWAAMVPGQVESSASASASSRGPVRVAIGTFVFAPGDKLALEIGREEPCPCLCDEIQVQAFQVLGPEGELVFEDTATAYPVAAGEWTGRWHLADTSGQPVPPGDYTAVARTSLGELQAQLRVADPEERLAGRTMARASMCGISLHVYRLVDEEDEGARLWLQVGESLMVALPGNPTTGYEWEVEGEPAFLALVPGVEYRADSGLLGAGGVFYFRYRAEEAGEGQLTFAYRRPWEAAPPERTFAVTVVVR
ncbi:MAG: protease inhibitor I42 family protein [Candidatus Bipolaricaulaceae bacterium]